MPLGTWEDAAQAEMALVSTTYMQGLAVCLGSLPGALQGAPPEHLQRGARHSAQVTALSARDAQGPELETSREASKAGRLL